MRELREARGGAKRLVGMVILSGEGEEGKEGASLRSGVLLSSLATPLGLGGNLPPSPATGVLGGALPASSSILGGAPSPGPLPFLCLSRLPQRKSHTCSSSSSSPPTVTVSHSTTTPEVERSSPLVTAQGVRSSRKRGARSSSGGEVIVRV